MARESCHRVSNARAVVDTQSRWISLRVIGLPLQCSDSVCQAQSLLTRTAIEESESFKERLTANFTRLSRLSGQLRPQRLSLRCLEAHSGSESRSAEPPRQSLSESQFKAPLPH